MTLLASSTLGGAFLSESAAVHTPSFTPPPVHFTNPHGAAKLNQKSETDLPQISQIFSCHLPRIATLPFFCIQTKIPKIGVIGGYLLIRVCRYKLCGNPAPFEPSVPEFNCRLHGFHRFLRSLPCN
jgi:hypothetical protein